MLVAPPVAHADIRQFGEDRVNLPKDEADLRREKIRDLREKLAGWIKQNPECGLVKSYLSGSLAKGTALRTSSDVDIALYLKYDGERRASRALSEWIAARLRKAYPQMAPDQIQPQEYSVTVTFKGAGFDVDIVPVFYEGDPQDRGWLVSKRTGRLLMTSIPQHLEFIRKRKHAHPQHYAQVVRLLKWWAHQLKSADDEFRFKSFMIELICAHLADGGLVLNSYPQSLEKFFDYIVSTGLKKRIAFSDYYRPTVIPASTDPIQVFDPVNLENNVGSRYTEQNRVRIVQAAQEALDALNEAHTASTKGHAVSMWRVVLGSSFRGAS